MAKNKVLPGGGKMSLPVTNPTSPHPLSGEPFRLGITTGVAQTDLAGSLTGNPAGFVSGDIGPGVWTLSVKGVNGGGNSAVNAGDPLFYVDGDTPPLSKKTAGIFFGIAVPNPIGRLTAYADPLVGAGATATIAVYHPGTPDIRGI